MNYGLLLLAAAAGFLLHFIIDMIWWKDRRVCSEEEIRLRDRVGSLEGDNKRLQGRVTELDAEREGWTTRFENQDREIANYQAKIADHESESVNLTKRIADHDAELASMKTKLADSESMAASLQAKVSDADSRIAGLSADLDAAKSAPSIATSGVAAGAAAVAGGAAMAAMGSDDDAASEDAAASAAGSVEKDDLQKLWGIGPASEKVLNDNGIYTYAQLCKSDSAELRRMLDESDGTFNLVREDTWPEQACYAEAERWPELETMQDELSADYVNQTVTTEFTGTPDDLTKLWGIGPKVEEVLHSKGVYKFDQLAGTPMRMLQGIITAAGPRFTLVQPELWIPQAKIAATGDWDALDALKAEISADNKK